MIVIKIDKNNIKHWVQQYAIKQKGRGDYWKFSDVSDHRQIAAFVLKKEKIKPKSAIWLLSFFESENWPHTLSLHALNVGGKLKK